MKHNITQARTSILYTILWPALKKSRVINEKMFAMEVRHLINNAHFNLPIHGDASMTPESYLLCAFNWDESAQGRKYWATLIDIWKRNK